MNKIRWLGILSLIGGVAGVFLFVAFANIGWAEPGTAVYQTYELLNRLMAVVLLIMSAGWLGAWRLLAGFGRGAGLAAFLGPLMMALGTAAEFWLFSDLPYREANLRSTAFFWASIGGLVLDLGAMGVGLSVWRSNTWPRWTALVLLLALPLDIFAFFVLGSPFLISAVLSLILGQVLLTNKQNSSTNLQRIPQ